MQRARSMTTVSSRFPRALVLAPLVVSLSGCAAIRGIFKAGVWVGVITVIIVLALIVWAIRAFSR
jgi:hypothetical protein